MTHPIRRLLTVYSVILTSSGLVFPLGAQNPASARESVAAAWRACAQTVRNNDPAGILNCWTEDGVYMAAGAKTASGRAALDLMIQGIFSTVRITDLTDHVDEILVDGNVAVQRGWYVETLQPKSGAAAITLRHRYLFVWRRERGRGWKIARAMANEAPEGESGH